MMISLVKKLPWLLLTCCLSATSSLAAAHVLNETSAQVILRDGQVEITIITDTEHLISSYQDSQAWLLGDVDQVMPENLSPAQQQAFVANTLKQKVSLSINQQVIPIKHATFVLNEVNSDNSNSRNGDIILYAEHKVAQVTDLIISFPKTLGTVHVSVVKPQYKILNPGESAHVVF